MLARTSGLRVEHVHQLGATPGGVDAFLAAPGPLPALPSSVAAELREPDEKAIESDLAWLEASGARIVSCLSADYPPLLRHIASAPPVLYVLGDVAALQHPQLAIVGSRNPTANGRLAARDFAACFARAGLTITSGLALGIDAAAHEGALLGGGYTVAVCGAGLDQIYPRQNAALAERIRANGALVSEFPPGTPPLRPHFPRRNRIISGLAQGCLVVEAARGSGSLITARLASEQGREVFAVPGSIHSPLSRGCHWLIREGAKLVETAEDVLSELPEAPRNALFRLRSSVSTGVEGPGPGMDKNYEMLLDAVGFEPASIDALVERTGLPSESIASMLLILELEGRVAPQPGGLFCRLSQASHS